MKLTRFRTAQSVAFYACNILFNVAEHLEFKKTVQVLNQIFRVLWLFRVITFLTVST